MFEIGWTEMLVIAVVMIVVVGPKDLPKMLRTFGRTTAKLRSMAGDFQRQFNEALKEAELDDVKKSVDSLRSLNPANEIKKQLNPFEKAASDVRAGLETLKPKDTPKPAPADAPSPEATAAEPLKTGAAAIPGETAAKSTPVPAAAPAAAVAAPVVTEHARKKAPARKPAAPKAATPTPEGSKASAKAKAEPKPAAPKAAAKPKTSPSRKKTEGSAT